MKQGKEVVYLPGAEMGASGIGHFIERAHREGGERQWLREAVQNSIEANADRIQVGIHWPSVEAEGVYRKMIVDNGEGMSPEELVRFFNQYGASGKKVGGEHENFGIGIKASTLDWNKAGLVVVSKKKGQDARMITIYKDASDGKFRLRKFKVGDKEGEVVRHFVEASGLDWRKLPELMKEQGTMLVMLGNDRAKDTVWGEEGRDSSGLKADSLYLNTRFYAFPDNVQINAVELSNRTRSSWPQNEQTARIGNQKLFSRYARGSLAAIVDPGGTGVEDSIESKGTEALQDGTKVHWFLRKPVDVSSDHIETRGSISVLYKNELFERTNSAIIFKNAGIYYPELQKRVWLVVEPPLRDASKAIGGVLPESSRNRLVWEPHGEASRDLPISEWLNEFADRLPEPILRSITDIENRQDTQDTDFKHELAELLKRWKLATVGVDKAGDQPRPTAGTPDDADDDDDTPSASGPRRRSESKERILNIPDIEWVNEDQMEDSRAFAQWIGRTSRHPTGLIQICQTHPIVRNIVDEETEKRPVAARQMVIRAIRHAFSLTLSSRVAHALSDKAFSKEELDTHLLSWQSLTMMAYGLIAETRIVSEWLRNQKIGTKRS